jgi:hypothetical protein
MTTEKDRKSPIAGKHHLWAGAFGVSLACIVLLEVFAEGRSVDVVVGFALGLLLPGSPLGGIARRGE